jgi:hypothetical protein
MIIVSMIRAEIWADRKSVMDAVITGFWGEKEDGLSDHSDMILI